MRIRLVSSVPLGMNEVEMGEGEITLRHLLDKVSAQARVPGLVDRRAGQVSRMFVVSVNHRQWESLPGGLDTPLKDGDAVEIALAMFAGGQVI